VDLSESARTRVFTGYFDSAHCGNVHDDFRLTRQLFHFLIKGNTGGLHHVKLPGLP
jgi:hypothetical protein